MLEQRARVDVGQIRGDGREPHAVEADDSRPRGDPEIAVPGLDDVGQGVVRQAFFDAPAVNAAVGPRRAKGGECQQVPGPAVARGNMLAERHDWRRIKATFVMCRLSMS